MEPVVAAEVGRLVMPGKPDDVTTVLLVEPPNIEDALLKDSVEAGFVVV